MQRPIEEDFGFIRLLMESGAGEDGLTQYLARLLQEPEVRDVFLRDVLEVPLTHSPQAEVTAEDADATERGVPDLSIRAGRDLFILVENKVGAAFTGNQPHEYLKSLVAWRGAHPAGLAMLVVQVPEGRTRALEQETWKRIEQHLGPCSPLDSVHQGVHVKVISWSQTVDAFDRAHFARPLLAFMVRSFRWLARIREEETTHMITELHLRSLSKDFLEAMAATEDHFRDLYRELSQSFKIEREDTGDEFTYRAFSIWPKLPAGKKDDTQELSVILSARCAARLGTQPLLLQLVGVDYINVERLRASGRIVVPGREVEVFGWVERPLVPLSLVAGLDPKEQVRRLFSEIQTIRLIAIANFPDFFDPDSFEGDRENTRSTDLAYRLVEQAGLAVERVFERRAPPTHDPVILFQGIHAEGRDALLEQLRTRAGGLTVEVLENADGMPSPASELLVRFGPPS